jgi:hypothetical protein
MKSENEIIKEIMAYQEKIEEYMDLFPPGTRSGYMYRLIGDLMIHRDALKWVLR